MNEKCYDTSSKSHFDNYTLDSYINDVKNSGLSDTWEKICKYITENTTETSTLLRIENLARLYEEGLAINDKKAKKKCGQYYTPDDVAEIMCQWLIPCDGKNVCDVGCGTGNLIIKYLELIGKEKAVSLISEGCLYLYDSDRTALNICRTILNVKYGMSVCENIHFCNNDFLDRNISLPENCKVISNPPYATLTEIGSEWVKTDVLTDSMEYYAVFMEKIFAQATSVSIITPFGFISGKKFYSLRRAMCSVGGGFIVSFDNVPGNIFKGKKHGTFNSNTSNSVRAAITVFSRNEEKGFRISPLIRFKNEQRTDLLCTSELMSNLPSSKQIVSADDPYFKKVDKRLAKTFEAWTHKSQYTVEDVLSKEKTEYMIDMPNTCRYFTTASSAKLNRAGSIISYVYDKSTFEFLYCFINSSFAYWWWRIFDGAITYPISLFKNMPLPLNLLNDDDKLFFEDMCKKMIEQENNFKITKKNAGELQENIKFPEEYRNIINSRILKILDSDTDCSAFNFIHSNEYLKGT